MASLYLNYVFNKIVYTYTQAAAAPITTTAIFSYLNAYTLPHIHLTIVVNPSYSLFHSLLTYC